MKQKLLILLIMSNIFLILTSCGSNKTIVDSDIVQSKNTILNEENRYTVESATLLVNSILPKNLVEENFKAVFENEVNFKDYTTFYTGTYYKFILKNEKTTLEPFLLGNKSSGVVTVCYSDDVVQVREDILLNPNKELIWQGNYWKELDEETPDNSYSILTVAKESENSLFITLDAYFGHGGLKFQINSVLENNISRYSDENMELEFILNEDNSITCNVLKGSDDIIEALQGKFK